MSIFFIIYAHTHIHTQTKSHKSLSKPAEVKLFPSVCLSVSYKVYYCVYHMELWGIEPQTYRLMQVQSSTLPTELFQLWWKLHIFPLFKSIATNVGNLKQAYGYCNNCCNHEIGLSVLQQLLQSLIWPLGIATIVAIPQLASGYCNDCCTPENGILVLLVAIMKYASGYCNNCCNP